MSGGDADRVYFSHVNPDCYVYHIMLLFVQMGVWTKSVESYICIYITSDNYGRVWLYSALALSVFLDLYDRFRLHDISFASIEYILLMNGKTTYSQYKWTFQNDASTEIYTVIIYGDVAVDDENDNAAEASLNFPSNRTSWSPYLVVLRFLLEIKWASA